MTTVRIRLAAPDEAYLFAIATTAGVTVDDAIRIALWNFARHLGLDIPITIFATKGTR